VFRKHLGWYLESAARHLSEEARRAARGWLCRLTAPREVEDGLVAFWHEQLA
jgi:hypothetical protein